METAFDSQKYMELQTKYIRERIERFDNKLYLEFGGKLFDDFHAARVLPGFDANAKIKLLMELKDITEIIFAISAPAIEHNKMRADMGITYDMDVLRLIKSLTALGLSINSVVITQYSDQPSAMLFHNKLVSRGIKTYFHRLTKGYPTEVDTILSDEGYGANPYIETTCPLVVVTAPGPGSGKLSTCLSQIYHESKRGISAGYAKFETFPIWNLPLKHPVNLAYEAATADLRDVNMIDPYHLEQYGVTTVNYNRDIEAFPVVKTVLSRVLGEDVYHSPTDMGVNMAGYAITDDAAVRAAGDLAGGEHIPQRNAVREQHGFLFLNALRHGAAEHARHERPEAVLRMAVEEIDLPGLDRGEAAEDKYFRVFVIHRPELPLYVSVFRHKRAPHKNKLPL